MSYDFNVKIDRNGLSLAKYDEIKALYSSDDIIPMWVADMELPTAQPIVDAIVQRAKKGMYGYPSTPDSFNRSIYDWQKRRNNWEMDLSLISFSPGVVDSINALILNHSQPDDKVLFFNPVYTNFFASVKRLDRKVITSNLVNTNGRYTIDFTDLEEKLSQRPKLFILCSPHNPVGRVWTKDELKRIGELCVKNNVMIISDEIHADLMLWGSKHTPTATISKEIADITVTLLSSTKTFNLAGLHSSVAVFPNEELKANFDNFWKRIGVTSNNTFSQVAVEAAFNHGEEWLEQLLTHLEGNMTYIDEFLTKYIPEITLELPEATYLLWLDCSGLNLEQDELKKFMVEKARLALNNGTDYGSKGEGFMRMNVACSKDTVVKAMDQLLEGVKQIRE